MKFSKIKKQEMHTAPKPAQMRSMIEQYLCVPDHFKPEHQHLDTARLLEQYRQFPENSGNLVLTSRPFCNLNNLFAARPEATKIVTYELEFCDCLNPDACWWITRTRYVMDQLQNAKVKNTFNGPALLSNLLPPIEVPVYSS